MMKEETLEKRDPTMKQWGIILGGLFFFALTRKRLFFELPVGFDFPRA